MSLLPSPWISSWISTILLARCVSFQCSIQSGFRFLRLRRKRKNRLEGRLENDQSLLFNFRQFNPPRRTTRRLLQPINHELIMTWYDLILNQPSTQLILLALSTILR